jgi:hypothetical protein
MGQLIPPKGYRLLGLIFFFLLSSDMNTIDTYRKDDIQDWKVS